VREERRAALIPYITAGYPSTEGTADLLRMLEAEGADLIEVGIPFSDPLADGPTIQRSTHAALQGGMTVARMLEAVDRANLSVPLIAFTYLNPILQFGLPRFVDAAASAGVSGVLLTDLPWGADPGIERVLRRSDLDVIQLVAPTTAPARRATIAAAAQGFLYVIARLGVTGTSTTIGEALPRAVRELRSETDLPIVVGFGIETADQARAIADFADGVVVGSALVRRLAEGLPAAAELMRSLRGALRPAPV